MKLTAQDYELLIKVGVQELSVFGRDQGTSLSFKIMRSMCDRLKEISLEYESQYPQESKRFSDES